MERAYYGERNRLLIKMKLPFPLIVEPPSSFTISPVALQAPLWGGGGFREGQKERVTLESRLSGPCLGERWEATGTLPEERKCMSGRCVWWARVAVNRTEPSLGQGIRVMRDIRILLLE